MNEINKNLYTKSEFAKKFSISRPTIDRHIKEGKLKAVQINGATLIKV